MKKVIAISITSLFLLSCGSVQKAGNNLADSLNRSGATSKIGNNYQEEASKYYLSADFPPENIYYIGQLVNKELLDNGNTIYIHRKEQDTGGEESGGLFSFNTESKKNIRYDMLAYLVGADGVIKDAAHGRYNTVRNCFGSVIGDSSFNISSERCNSEQFNQELTQSKNIIKTSQGQPISVWRN